MEGIVTPHSILLHPNNRFAYIAATGHDEILTFHFDDATGQLARRGLQCRIVTQRLVIVEIFVAQRDAEDPLRQHLTLLVLDVHRVTRIGQAGIDRVDQTQASVDFAEQQHAGI